MLLRLELGRRFWQYETGHLTDGETVTDMPTPLVEYVGFTPPSELHHLGTADDDD